MKFTTAAAASALTAAVLLAGCRPPERGVPDTAAPSATAQATQATAAADAAATPSATAATGATSGSGAVTAAGTETVSITPTGFEMGDLFHVTTREGGANSDFTVNGGEALMPFLLAHRNQTVQATVRRAREGQMDEQGLPQQSAIVDAAMNGQTAAQWWAAQSATDRQRLTHEAQCATIPAGNARPEDHCPAQAAR